MFILGGPRNQFLALSSWLVEFMQDVWGSPKPSQGALNMCFQGSGHGLGSSHAPPGVDKETQTANDFSNLMGLGPNQNNLQDHWSPGTDAYENHGPDPTPWA